MGAWLLASGLNQMMVIVSGCPSGSSVAAATAPASTAAVPPVTVTATVATTDKDGKSKDEKHSKSPKKEAQQNRINLSKV